MEPLNEFNIDFFAQGCPQPTEVPTHTETYSSELVIQLDEATSNFARVASTMKELAETMDSLECSMYSIGGAIKRLEAVPAPKLFIDNPAIVSLKEKNESLEKEITTLQQELDRMKTEAEKMSEANEALMGKVSNYQINETCKNKRISELEQRVNDLEYILYQEKTNVLKLKEEKESLENRQIMGKEMGNGNVTHEARFRQAPDAVVAYARHVLAVFDVAVEVQKELDILIVDHYAGNDDINYFFARRRLKYMQATDYLASMYRHYSSIALLADMSVVAVGSDIDTIVGSDEMAGLDAFRYYMYTETLSIIVGPMLILLREMAGMTTYTNVANHRNADRIDQLHARLMEYTSKLGYRLVDASLFQPMPQDPLIECTQQLEIDFEGLRPGDVCELVHLAVLYGSATDHTEVKIKK